MFSQFAPLSSTPRGSQLRPVFASLALPWMEHCGQLLRPDRVSPKPGLTSGNSVRFGQFWLDFGPGFDQVWPRYRCGSGRCWPGFDHLLPIYAQPKVGGGATSAGPPPALWATVVLGFGHRFGRRRPMLVQLQPNALLGDLWPKVGAICGPAERALQSLGVGVCAPICLGPCSAKSMAQVRMMPARSWTEFGPSWAEHVWHSAEAGQCPPTLARFHLYVAPCWPNVYRTLPELGVFGRSWRRGRIDRAIANVTLAHVSSGCLLCLIGLSR